MNVLGTWWERRQRQRQIEFPISEAITAIWPDRKKVTAKTTTEYLGGNFDSYYGHEPNVQVFIHRCARFLASIPSCHNDIRNAVTQIVDALPSTSWRVRKDEGMAWASDCTNTWLEVYTDISYEAPDLDALPSHSAKLKRLFPYQHPRHLTD